MYISKITIKGYKSINQIDLHLNPNLNILVGKNGAGKTAIIDCIKGTIIGFDTEKPQAVTIELTDCDSLIQNITSILKSDPAIVRLPALEQYLKQSDKLKKIKINYDPYFGASYVHLELIEINPEKITVNLQNNKLTILEHATRDVDLNRVEKIKQLLTEKFLFIPEMRNFKEKFNDPTNLNETGENILTITNIDQYNFLNLFKKMREDTGIKHKKYDEIVTQFEKEILPYKIIPKDNNQFKVSKIVAERDDNDTIISNTNSHIPSGILQELFFKFVNIYATKMEQTLIYEEPENNLHPGLQKKMASILKKRKGQTILTTHSEEFVDWQLFQNINLIKLYPENNQEVTKIKSYEPKIKESEKSKKENINETNGMYYIDKRVLFSDLVLLCEGESEVRILKEILLDTPTKINVDLENILILDGMGEDKLESHKFILDAFNIPYLIIKDRKLHKQFLKCGWDKENKRFILPGNDFTDLFKEKPTENKGYYSSKTVANYYLEKSKNKDKNILDYFKDEIKYDDDSTLIEKPKERFNEMAETIQRLLKEGKSPKITLN